MRILGSCFGLGLLPGAPGTWGSLGGVALAVAASLLPGTQLWLAGALLAVAAAAVPLARAAERLAGREDPGWFVLDEVAGYLVAVLGLPKGWPVLLACFFAFRLFDILKPWPLRRLERVPAGAGVVLDDLAAGVYANLLVRLVVLWL